MAKMTFELTAGRLARRYVKRMARSLAARAGVTLECDEDRGWLSSQLIYVARGSDDEIKLFRDLYLAWTDVEADCEGRKGL